MRHAHVTVQSQSSTTVENKDGSTTTTTVVARTYLDGDQNPGEYDFLERAKGASHVGALAKT
jgi:hypothetical protein